MNLSRLTLSVFLSFQASVCFGLSCISLLNESHPVLQHRTGIKVQLHDYPAPRYETFYLGEGRTSKVFRVIDTRTNQSFVLKQFKVIGMNNFQNDLKMMNVLRTFNPHQFGLRMIRVLNSQKQISMTLEDVRGVTLFDAVHERLLPEPVLDRLLQDLYNFQKEVYGGLRSKRFFSGGIKFLGPKTTKFPKGIPVLKVQYGYFSKYIFLKADNILVDLDKLELVIIDPN